MDPALSPTPAKPNVLDWIFRVGGFLLLVAAAFATPGFPSAELDSSWRMALGKFFVEGRQFGTDVVFTYGPLGWAMGKTYWGGQWASLIGWHAVQAVVFSAVIYWHAWQLRGYAKIFFLGYFYLVGMSYQDAIHQIIIAFAGMELIRRAGNPWRWSSLGWIALLAVLALVKFTNLVLCVVLVSLAGGLEFWLRRSLSTLRVPLTFAAAFVLGWLICGQNPANLPAYFHSSWEISEGYQDAMGFSCPRIQLIFGVCTVALVLVYLVLNFITHPQRARGAALTLAALALIYLNWKHGFIRADGHQVGFYYAAFSIILGAPFLLGDGPRHAVWKYSLRAAAGLSALIAIELVLPGVARGALGSFQGQVDRNINFLLGNFNTHELYQAKLEAERTAGGLLKAKSVIGRASVDVLGYEQGIAIFNDFNYHPRPVFQGYSAYTPYLARLNYDYYASDAAPEYVLFKLETIDYRLATMDDPHVLRLLVQRYTYLFTEQGFTVWKRKPGHFHAAEFESKPLRAFTAHFGERISVEDLKEQNLWAEINYDLSLVGRLRRFFFKPPLVELHITDDRGVSSVYRLPRPIGRAGFILNPVMDDLLEFMRGAGGLPRRRVSSISIETAPQDRDCFRDDISITLSSLPPSDAGIAYFKEADKVLFNMFVNAPVSYTALNPPNEETIDKRKVMMMHAPSEMVFDVPAGATQVSGAYGFVPGAYSNGGRTNGAEFIIYWSDGGDKVILHQRFMDPLNKLNDRGLQKFSVHVPKSFGHVYMRVDPGPYGEYAFDWTGWADIEFK